MKKIFMLAAMAATLFAVSCNRTQSPVTLNEEEDNSPVAVKFSANAAAVRGVTKAAVDEFSGAEVLYIYGLEGAWDKESGEFQPNGNILIDNVAALSPVLAATPSADIPDNMLKEGIEVWDPAYLPDEVPFFYGANGEVYNFYGYYVGNAFGAQTPAPDADFALPVVFDGTQDIMLATTDRVADYEERTEDFNEWTVYSAKAARKDVHPNLIFKHQLSRFVFQLQFRPVDRVDEAQNIQITGISLVSPHNEVTLDIDDQDAVFGGEETIFALHNIGGDLYPNPDSNDITETGLINTTDWTQAGESIMVAPGYPVYHMIMTYNYTYNGIALLNLPAFEWDIDLPALLDEEEYVAEAGKKYIVKLVVYGPEEVKISVTLEDWDEIELPEIDPDAEPED